MKYFEAQFTVSPMSDTATDILAALLGDAGFETFETTGCGLKGYVQQNLWDASAVDDVLACFPMPDVSVEYTLQEAPDEDWNSAWEETFTPIRIDDAVCVHDMRYPADDSVQYDIRITPRLAFGTGSHQTTRMLLRALAEMPMQGWCVVDAGTGTGILAIMTLLRGASDVFAYDIDEWSVRNAQENAALNDVQMTVVEGDASVLADVRGRDLVIANINRNILLADMPAFAAALRPGGALLLSGFYTDDIPYLTEKAATLGMTLNQQWSDEGWAALLFLLKE